MTPLLEQFIAESREFLQAISTSVMALEQAPDNSDLMTELFRQVHTLKGNSGLFEFPAMTRVLHAAEDLMDAIRHGKTPFSHQVTDVLLDAMDFVSQLFDEIESHESLDASRDHAAAELAQLLRDRLPPPDTESTADSDALPAPVVQLSPLERLRAIVPALHSQLVRVPENQRMALFTHAQNGEPLWWVQYQPEPECFFKGEDPLFLAMETPGLVVAGVDPRTPWPALAQLDAYRCELQLSGVSTATHAALDEHFRYVPEQVQCIELPNVLMVLPSGDENGGPVYEDFVLEALATLERGDLVNLRRITQSLLEFSSPSLWLSSALRWLLLILDQCPERTGLLKGLIESIHTLHVPDWLAQEPALEQTTLASDENSVEAAAVLTDSTPEIPAPTGVTSPAEPLAAPTFALLHTLNDTRRRALQALLHAQLCILELPVNGAFDGRIKAVLTTLSGCAKTVGADETQLDALRQAAAQALANQHAEPMQLWVIDFCHACEVALPVTDEEEADEPAALVETPAVASLPVTEIPATPLAAESLPDETPAAARATARAPNDEPNTTTSSKTLRVEQTKIDRLMNLIGEMVVAKNALPYLASRAENQYGVRELARDIKTQYGVINRIAEEMQDAIMQVRMMPVSFIFQRFPRLVRDLSNKLGKDVHLVLEGEDTEADKNVIEALADPLIHIVRNSLDHGLELPAVRKACGKPEKGRLQISARQESDHVTIEIVDDGKGIDPLAIKRSAYQKGLIDEDRLETMSDQEAVNLVFLPGFSTAETITDVSGRGVGMDVVRSAIQRVGGTVHLSSILGQGTRLHLSLPLSMAVTNVMIVESARQIFGFTMDAVVETVRLPRAQIRYFKQHATTVLRERVIPLFSLNDLLALDVPQQANDQDELALLVLRLGTQQVGLLVDAFLETTDIILKPLPGVLGGLRGYSGSALLGDGSVLMVLNHKELF